MSRQSRAPIPTISGNFDFPPASSSTPPPPLSSSSADPSSESASNTRTRLQHLRSVLRQERERDRSAREAVAAERQRNRAHGRSPTRPRLLTRRGRGRREIGPAGDGIISRRISMLPSPSPPPPSRLRATPGERFQNLRRQRQQREQSRNALDELEEASERLAQASTDLATLLSPTNFYLRDIPGRLTPGDSEPGSHQRRKRRKLDHDSDVPAFQGFRYGHFGQVASGKLKMELVSCDGGDFEEDNLALYRAENILKNDKSVYCTKSNSCNVLLRHQGETTFCLEKLVIKTPERGFTAPVQEGMVFVSMTNEGLIRGTSRYQIHYADSPTRPRRPSNPRDHEQLSLLESLNDPEVMAAAPGNDEEEDEDEDDPIFGYTNYHFPVDDEPGADERRLARLIRTRRRFEQMYLNRDDQSTSPPQNNSPASGNDQCDWPFAEHETTARDLTAPTPPPITITTETDNDSTDEEVSSAAILADRERRDNRWRPDSDSEEFHFPRPIEILSRSARRRRGSIGYIRSVQRTMQSRIEAREGSPDDGGDLIEPHAQFFIEKNRSKVTIKFDPPVSGKYMLLKLWSPSQDTNIDVQTVMTYGYAGPRYFPSYEMR